MRTIIVIGLNFFCLVKFYSCIFLGYILINLFFLNEKIIKFFDNFFNFS